MNDRTTDNVQEETFPLAGFTVAITASRRHDELKTAFEKLGAKVVVGSSIEILPLDNDGELKAVSEECISTRLDYVVATTGIGFRAWMEAADAWGIGESLRNAISNASILARGPKARGAIRASGLTDVWMPSSESSSEVVDYLLERDLKDKTVVIQQHSEPLRYVEEALKAAGASVISVPVYRWVLSGDLSDVRRVLEQTISGQIDCVTFTSAAAVFGFLKVAKMEKCEESLIEVLRAGVSVVCVGPICSAPLRRLDVPVSFPPRARFGALVHLVAQQLPREISRSYQVYGHRLEIRGHAVVLDGRLINVPPTPMSILKGLAKEPGKVLTRTELIELLPGEETGPHALEMTLTRLRSILGDGKIIQTVVKRGYRLAYSPESVDFDSDGVCRKDDDTGGNGLTW